MLLRRARTPQYKPTLARPNLANPLLRDIRMLVLLNEKGGSPRCAITGAVGVREGSTAWGSSDKGAVLSFDGVDDDVLFSGAFSNISGSTGTFFMYAPVVRTQDSSGTVLWGSNTGATTWFQVDTVAADDTFAFGTQISGMGANFWSSTNTAIILAGNGSTQFAYLGTDQAGWESNSAVSAGTAWGAGAKNIELGGFIGGGSWDFDGEMLVAGYSARVWSEDEAMSFWLDPMQVIAPQSRRALASVAAPSGRIMSSLAGGGGLAGPGGIAGISGGLAA